MKITPTNYQKHLNTNPIQRFLINRFYSAFFDIIGPLQIESILDAGCGEGFTLYKLSSNNIGKRLEGIDNSNEAIKLGSEMYPDLTLKKGSIYKLPYKDNAFDVVLCMEVLEHLNDPSKAVQELKRVTNTYVLFSVPNEPFFIGANFLRGKYINSFGNHPEHIQHWTSFGFRKFLVQNGLEIVNLRRPFPWTMVLAKKKK